MLFLVVLVAGSTAFAFADGWVGVSDSCGGTFYLKRDNYQNFEQFNAAVERFDKARCGSL